MPMYSFRCTNCGAGQTINSSIRDYPDVPNARCMACKAGEMKRDYRADKPQPAPMWPDMSIDDSRRTCRPAQSYSRSTTVE